jgi:hypothetical protein
MIKQLSTNSSYIFLSQTNSKQYFSPGASGSGMVRYNPNMSRMEVNDGAVWLGLGDDIRLELSKDAIDVIDWAKNKMAEEAEIKRLAESRPALKTALDNVEQARRELDLIFNLSKTY